MRRTISISAISVALIVAASGCSGDSSDGSSVTGPTSAETADVLSTHGACLSGTSRVMVYAADGDESDATQAVTMSLVVPAPAGGYDLSEKSPDATVVYYTGGRAQTAVCDDVARGEDGDIREEAVAGHVSVIAEFEDGDSDRPIRTRVSATGLVFANGRKVDDIHTGWIEVGHMPGA